MQISVDRLLTWHPPLWQVFRRAESDVRRAQPPRQGMERTVSNKSDTVSPSPDTAPSLVRMDDSEVGKLWLDQSMVNMQIYRQTS